MPPAILDLSISDDEETLVVASRTSSSRKRKPEPVDLRSDSEQDVKPPYKKRSKRVALQELTPEQFANRVRGPKAWVKRPKYDPHFIQQWSAPLASTNDPCKDIRSFFKACLVGKNARNTSSQRAPDSARTRRKIKLVEPDYEDDLEESEHGDDLAGSDYQDELESDYEDERESDFEDELEEPDGEDELEVDDATLSDDSESIVAPIKSKSKSKLQSTTKKPAPAAATKTNVTGKSKTAGGSKRTTNLTSRVKNKFGNGLDLSLAPISDIRDIFEDLTRKALSLGLDRTLQDLSGRPLRVATMCSGTESPLLALEMIRDTLQLSGSKRLDVEHLFSAEIVPYKQAYIERNFSPPIIFRDITELTSAVDNEEPRATTAYGAKVAIPTDVDIIIAGTSCVDFSNINKHKKGIEDGGESGDTFKAVLAYCRAYRPSIVLLENVATAPYDSMMAQYEANGYEVASVKVDTKNFYIPHTRQRGYMACFSRDKIGGTGAAKAAREWALLMANFRRLATAPVSSFLLPDYQIDHKHIRVDDAPREVDWSKCEISQMDYRQTKKLGSSRPFTNWSESGSLMPPDNSDTAYFRSRVERELDCMDCSILRKARPENGNYDCRFKTRIWDLSQNIYINQDSNAFGITGCLTPTMKAFVSDACRPLDAKESLQLQGIPLHKISFTTETHAEIQDLAGNAMSSTVVGAGILSALIAATQLQKPCVVKSPRKPIKDEPSAASGLLQSAGQISSVSIAAESIDMPDLIARAKRALRRCYCERGTGMVEKPIQRCADCGHTTCTSCGGNPQHNYEPTYLLGQARTSPIDFEEHVRSTMPLLLKFSITKLPQALSEEHRNSASRVLESILRFQSVRRTHCWTVTYSAEPHGRLELVLGENTAEWRLYAHAEKDLPANSKLRALLQQPVMRSIAISSFQNTTWQVRVPTTTDCRMTVRGSGRHIASWRARLGLPDFKEHTVWERLEVELGADCEAESTRSLNGAYRYLARCGTAEEGLYKKDGSEDRAPIYMFLDPDRIGRPEDDCYVFSHSKDLLEYDEIRPTIARIAPGWRPWSSKPDQRTPSKFETTLHTIGSWQEIQTSLDTVVADIKVCKPVSIDELIDSMDCTKAACILSCTVHGIPNIDHLHEDQRAATLAWVFEAMRRQLPVQGWRELPKNFTDHCEACAPAMPPLRWQLVDREIKEYEDSAGATKYERAVKARPTSVAVQTTRLDESTTFAFGINFASLAHRATSRLSLQGHAITQEWRLITNSREADFVFKPFKLQSTRGIEPYSNDLKMSVELFPKQLQALSWMKAQEQGIPFELEEVEEGAVPYLGWRAEVRSRTAVEVRGGICADHPGFGKTITSLALIQSELLEAPLATIAKKLAIRQGPDAGRIPLAATLIVCPTSLQRQWIEEIGDKLGSLNGVLSVTTAANLSKFSLEDFRKAKIIVVNRAVLASEAYIERLAIFAAMPGPATSSRRGLTQWLAFAAKQIPEHVRILTTKGQPALKQHVRCQYRRNVESEDFKAFVPSRRLRGKDYVAAKQSKEKSTEKPALKEIDVSQIATPLFEMFYFNRVIIDEFHQYDTREHAAACAIKADKRWLLSGTPAIGDFYEVAQMAKLLGVPLRTGRDDRGSMKTKSIRELRQTMTDFERFDAARQHASNASQARIYQHHRNFLDTFVRQNILEFAEFKVQEHLLPVKLDPDHAALYTEVSQQLNSLDMRIKKGNRREATDREERFIDASKSSATAEEALSKLAAFYDRSSNVGLEELLARRHKEVAQIKGRLPSYFFTARSKEPDKFQTIRSQIESGAFGDEQITEDIVDIMHKSKTMNITAARSVVEDDLDDDEQPKSRSARTESAALNTLCKRLVTAQRSARYLLNILALQKLSRKTSKCDHPTCSGQDQASQFAISALCGHKLCGTCQRAHKDSADTRCPAGGCSSALKDFHLLEIGKLGVQTKAPYGAKLQAVTSLLESIQNHGEQAILFVQFEEQMREAAAALREAEISSTIVNTAAEAGARIAAFRESSGTDDQITVIVLNASDETAAGSNLQNANHVLFLSPLLRDSQYGYEATNAQAIGRVRRYGQKRDIHVYRIAALNTIDVDILEHRDRRVDAVVELGASEVSVPSELEEKLDVHGEPVPERTQLVREHGKYSLRPRSWLLRYGADDDDAARCEKVKGKNRILGWEDFSSLVKFSRAYTEDDE